MGIGRLISLLTVVCSSSSERSERFSSPKGSCKSGKSDKSGELLLLSPELVSVISGSLFLVPASRLFFVFFGLMTSPNHYMNWRLSKLDIALATAFDDVPDLLFFFISFFCICVLVSQPFKVFLCLFTLIK